MIRYRLRCDNGHDFEGWFRSSDDFDAQRDRGLVTCTHCASVAVEKVLMAPSVATARKKEARQTMALEVAQREAVARLRAAVAEIRANAEDVGDRFAEEARRIHYGETTERGIIGQTTPDEAHALLEEGIAIAPLPVLPDDAN